MSRVKKFEQLFKGYTRKLTVNFAYEEDLKEFLVVNDLPTDLSRPIRDIYLPEKKIIYKNEPVYIKARSSYWESEWFDMPELAFQSRALYAKINVFFSWSVDTDDISIIMKQQVTEQTRSVWFPKKGKVSRKTTRFVGGESPKYPIYVVSKGRSWLKKMATSWKLTYMEIPHFLVVEPPEFDEYVKAFASPYCTVLHLDMSYKDTYDRFAETPHTQSTGPGPARNFCWEHSIAQGYAYHWVMDDNLNDFLRCWRGRRYFVKTGAILRACEAFMERYENLAISGPNYAGFCADGDNHPAFYLNTRIYSCLLIRNDIPYRWRGVYNEDTDLCLRALKDGWCTALFQFFLVDKIKTQELRGGNTDEFYIKEGTIYKSQMLVDMHPDITETVFRYGRVHHKVDYTGFTHKLKLRDGYSRELGVNEYGMVFEEIS